MRVSAPRPSSACSLSFASFRRRVDARRRAACRGPFTHHSIIQTTKIRVLKSKSEFTPVVPASCALSRRLALVLALAGHRWLEPPPRAASRSALLRARDVRALDAVAEERRRERARLRSRFHRHAPSFDARRRASIAMGGDSLVVTPTGELPFQCACERRANARTTRRDDARDARARDGIARRRATRTRRSKAFDRDEIFEFQSGLSETRTREARV